MEKRLIKLLVIALGVIFAGCSSNNPLFKDMRDGRADKLESIEINQGDVLLRKESFKMLTVTGRYNDGSSEDITAKCEWICDDQKVAVVSANGYLQSRALVGTAYITARYGSLSCAVKVEVDIRLVSLSISPTSTTLRSNNQICFSATGTTSDGVTLDLTKTVQWSVSPDDCAEIDTNGLFMAREISGNITVTAKSPDGKVLSNEGKVILELSELYVDKAYTGTADGTKEKPFRSISRAVAHAETTGAVRINVAKGVYNEDLIIKHNISLFGGYVSVYSGADWTRSPSVVPSDTQIQAIGNTAILYLDGLTAATVIDGFRVVGGDNSALSTTTAIMCSNASPSIRNNEIYGGKSSRMSVGILNQTSSPVIENNPVISGGLPSYSGGGVDNIAILCQSFSNPIIKGNGSAAIPSQIITGPSGDESTYRIKCESSSNPEIDGNTVEATVNSKVASARGILAMGSSPYIHGNNIVAASPDCLCIRGENTSFRITGNTIAGRITVTSVSKNPSIFSNLQIGGSVLVEGGSSGVSIRDNINIDASDSEYKVHYGRSMKNVIRASVEFSGSASGIVSNNALGFLSASDGANVVFDGNYIITTDRVVGIMINGASGSVTRNLVCVECDYDSGTVAGIHFGNSTKSSLICNNIVFSHNTSTSSPTGSKGISVNYCMITCMYNNIIITRNDSVESSSHAIGFFLKEFNERNTMRLFNNIIRTVGGGIGIVVTDKTLYPSIITNNIFIGTPTIFHDSVDSYANIDEFESLDRDNFKSNVFATISVVGWESYLSSGSLNTFADNIFRIKTSSILHKKGKSPDDYIGTPYGSAFAVSISPDFAGKIRTRDEDNTMLKDTGLFSAGPYEP